MQIDFQLHIQAAGKGEIDPDLFRLLREIRGRHTLKLAAQNCGLSYRHAWGLIKKWEHEINACLVKLERGRGGGAALTALSEQLLWTQQYINEKLTPEITEVRNHVNTLLAEHLPSSSGRIIKLHASHGMAISHIYELLHADTSAIIEFQVHGSLESLRNLYTGQCQIAGFHLPLQKLADDITQKYRDWLIVDQHLILQVAIRDQGLMVRKGNPLNIRSPQDLARQTVRFVNRQQNSGTRTIFDQLLKRDNLRPEAINGYDNEEFTHVAVAAMIASGVADAGFGIKAAAVQFELDFIPVLQEIYLLALDRNMDKAIIENIRNLLLSRRFKNRINKIAGYHASLAGKEMSLNELPGHG